MSRLPASLGPGLWPVFCAIILTSSAAVNGPYGEGNEQNQNTVTVSSEVTSSSSGSSANSRSPSSESSSLSSGQNAPALSFRTFQANWAVPEDAIFARIRTSSACQCNHLCLSRPNCAAAELVDHNPEALMCLLATRRGNSSIISGSEVGFVRYGHVDLGDGCLSGEECMKGECVQQTCTFTDCSKLYGITNPKSGVYRIQVSPGEAPRDLFCDMETHGGGWTVFQRRIDVPDEQQINFTRPWKDYRDGFGNLSGQLWLGNEVIHKLTSRGPHELWIDLESFAVGDSPSEKRYARYGTFSVGPEETEDNRPYVLSIGSFSGDVGDSMAYHNNQPFSTYDKDLKEVPTPMHCARSYRAGWWYKKCHRANMNGIYMRGKMEQGENDIFALGVSWWSWLGYLHSLKHTEMKLRPNAKCGESRHGNTAEAEDGVSFCD